MYESDTSNPFDEREVRLDFEDIEIKGRKSELFSMDKEAVDIMAAIEPIQDQGNRNSKNSGQGREEVKEERKERIVEAPQVQPVVKHLDLAPVVDAYASVKGRPSAPVQPV